MIAILSDIHANLEALDAVLNDIATFDVEEIVCLGDIIGYGPNPCECLELAMDWNVVLKGDFEQALIDADPDWPKSLLAMLDRTREKIESYSKVAEMMTFINRRPAMSRIGEFEFAHASPRSHLNEYVFPEHIYDQKKLAKIFDKIERGCFVGHTHIPGVFLYENENFNFRSPSELGEIFTIGDAKFLCNVGSVGQPRDEDPRACYVLLDQDSVVYRRIDYDFEATWAKIVDDGDDDMNGSRLSLGR